MISGLFSLPVYLHCLVNIFMASLTKAAGLDFIAALSVWISDVALSKPWSSTCPSPFMSPLTHELVAVVFYLKQRNPCHY